MLKNPFVFHKLSFMSYYLFSVQIIPIYFKPMHKNLNSMPIKVKVNQSKICRPYAPSKHSYASMSLHTLQQNMLTELLTTCIHSTVTNTDFQSLSFITLTLLHYYY